jgi:hypothetical protein
VDAVANPSPPAQDASRLRELLREHAAGLCQDAVAEAISVGPDAAGELVASLLDAAHTTGSGRSAAIRAAWLAGELRLERAVPALVRCVEQLPEGHPLREAALLALGGVGPAAAAALLDAFGRAGRPEERGRVADGLALVGVDDDRIRAALVRTMEDDPARGARLLAARGEWRAVPDLLHTFDRLAREPIADCVLCDGMHLGAIASAVRELGGELSPAQLEQLDDVLERGDPLWLPGPDPLESHPVPRAPRLRPATPGRNDPCPCGSGKKYKRCHLEEDLRSRVQ